MEDTKRATVICYVIQIVLIFLLILSAILSWLGIARVQMRSPGVVIIYLINFLICNILFFKAFRKNLKEISLTTYDQLFKNFPYNNGFMLIEFALNKGADDTACINKAKMYMKSYFLLAFIIFIQVAIILIIG